MGIKFEFLRAGNGDCIWITTEERVNILIDGGFTSTYNNEIKPRVQELRRKNQKLDLVVLTHYDVDHIGGISKLIEEESKYKSDTIIKEIWFNAFENAKFPIEDNEEDNLFPINQLKHNKTGAKQQKEFEEFIADIRPYIEYRNLIDLISVDKITQPIEKENMVILSPYTDRAYKSNKDIKITLLSPNDTKLNSCKEKDYEKNKTGKKERDWDKSFSELLNKINKKDNSRNPNRYLDSAKPNGASIAFILEYKNKKYLFLGDAHIDLIATSLIQLGFTKENPLVVEFIKLSHHGSKANINKTFLHLTKSSKFVILANGNKSHYHPDKETLVRIMDFYQNQNNQIYFVFNHVIESVFDDAYPIFSSQELEKYNTTLIHENILKDAWI